MEYIVSLLFCFIIILSFFVYKKRIKRSILASHGLIRILIRERLEQKKIELRNINRDSNNQENEIFDCIKRINALAKKCDSNEMIIGRLKYDIDCLESQINNIKRKLQYHKITKEYYDAEMIETAQKRFNLSVNDLAIIAKLSAEDAGIKIPFANVTIEVKQKRIAEILNVKNKASYIVAAAIRKKIIK